MKIFFRERGEKICQFLISAQRRQIKKKHRNAHIQHFVPMKQKLHRKNRSWFWTTAKRVEPSFLGYVSNQSQRTAFEFKEEDGVRADILKIDSRFVSLIKWLGENHINIRLSGQNTEGRICCTRSVRLLLAEAPSFLLRTDFFSL